MPSPADLRRTKRARAVRRATLAVLFTCVVAGAFGAFGVRSGRTTAAADGTALAVTYPVVARPGLAAPFEVELTRADGFDAPVDIEVSAGYLAMFDENGLDPEPAEATSSDEWVRWTFDPPPGTTLLVALDARIEPGVQLGRRGVVRVRSDAGVVEASFRTVVMP